MVVNVTVTVCVRATTSPFPPEFAPGAPGGMSNGDEPEPESEEEDEEEEEFEEEERKVLP